MKCKRCRVEIVDGHQCDPTVLEAREKALAQWRKEVEEDKMAAALILQDVKKNEEPRRLAGPPLYRGGLVARQRIGGAKTK
jgi:hypothetical protein